jgi:hyperosmotically inducible periplasmic protein
MTNSQEFGKRSFLSLSMAVTLFTGALLGNMAWAQAAPDAPASTESSPADKKTESVMSDTWITTKVKSEILANSMSKAFKVGVTTTHGVVLLSGKLPNQDAIDLVKMTAEKVKGVKSVDVSGLSIAP